MYFFLPIKSNDFPKFLSILKELLPHRSVLKPRAISGDIDQFSIICPKRTRRRALAGGYLFSASQNLTVCLKLSVMASSACSAQRNLSKFGGKGRRGENTINYSE